MPENPNKESKEILSTLLRQTFKPKEDSEFTDLFEALDEAEKTLTQLLNSNKNERAHP